jgi:hypothetical protein
MVHYDIQGSRDQPGRRAVRPDLSSWKTRELNAPAALVSLVTMNVSNVMCDRPYVLLLASSVLCCGCDFSAHKPDTTPIHQSESPAGGGEVPNPFIETSKGSEFGNKTVGDLLNEAEGADKSKPPASPVPKFDLQNRASTDAFLKKKIDTWNKNTDEQNPLVKERVLASLLRELDDLNTQYKGQKVSWKFKTARSEAPPAVVVKAPSDFLSSSPGVSYAVSSADRIGDLRGMNLGGVTQSPVPPRLVVGTDITEEDFGKLKADEEFLVEGTIQELKYPSLRMMSVSLMIDVYIRNAMIAKGPL